MIDEANRIEEEFSFEVVVVAPDDLGGFNEVDDLDESIENETEETINDSQAVSETT